MNLLLYLLILFIIHCICIVLQIKLVHYKSFIDWHPETTKLPILNFFFLESVWMFWILQSMYYKCNSTHQRFLPPTFWRFIFIVDINLIHFVHDCIIYFIFIMPIFVHRTISFFILFSYFIWCSYITFFFFM